MKTAVGNVNERVAGPRRADGGSGQGYDTLGLHLTAKSGVQKTGGVKHLGAYPPFFRSQLFP